MVSWVRTLTQPQWRVEAGACLGLYESLDGRPQFPGNDCAFSSLLESYLLSPSTWDGYVKHGLRLLRSRPAAHAARQLTHISANKYEARGNWLLLVRNAGGMCQTGNPESKITSRAALDCDEYVSTNDDSRGYVALPRQSTRTHPWPENVIPVFFLNNRWASLSAAALFG